MADKKPCGCPACQSLKKIELGEKYGFLMLSCKNYRSIYSLYLPSGEEAKNYDNYYNEEALPVPDSIRKRVGEIVDDFSPYFYNYFDVIAASEIIEHCLQLEILLDEVIRILRPRGLFWATTPSAGGLSYKLTGLDWTIIFPPPHLQLFSKKAICLMRKKAGFSQVEIQTSGFNPSEVIDTFRHRLSASGEDTKEFFPPVNTGHTPNESLTKSRARQKIKNLLNGALDFLSLEDSLKIKAVK